MANTKIFQYDVFLNHRGPDTKEQFLVPLVEKLHEAGIERSFLDKNIHPGEMVFTVIEEALESARMHIAFFSRNYARSSYCLKELHQMLLTGSPIITVFYDVAPEHVRRPRNIGPYVKALQRHAEREEPQVVESWEAALEKAAAIKGFVRASYGGDDELLAKDIVKQVVKLLCPPTVTIPPRWGQYDWRSHYRLPTKGQGIIFFAADTNKNLHITFSPEAGIVFPSYEIVIGRQPTSQYTRSEIRRHIPQRTVCSYYPLDVTNPYREGELQHFWICVDAETQLIYVGRGKHLEEEAAFMIFKDPSFLENILYFAFSTDRVAITYTDITVEGKRPALLGNYGQDSSSALWSSIDASQVLPPSPDVKFSKLADNYGDYNWSKAYKLPTKGRGIVCFSVKAITDVHVAISPKPQTMDPMYEIVVCGWGNSESGIQRKGQEGMLCCVTTFGLIQLGRVSNFWVSINADTQLIHVGAGNQPNLASVVCVYKDPYFISEARYVSFFSWDTDAVYSSIFVASPSASRLLSPEPLELSACWGQYDWILSYQLLSEGQGILYFAADARTDIHVAISSQCETMDPMYEIVIGGWGNTKSGIRRRAQGELLCYVDEGFDDTEDLNHFWVSIDKDTQLIQVGQGHQANLDSVIFMFKDPGFLREAMYIAFSSWNTPITYSSVSVSFQSATITTPIENVAIQELSQEPIYRANILLQDPKFKMVILQDCWGHYGWQKYLELPCKGQGVVYFAAETITDVHVAISPWPETVNPMYEIVIGGWNNSMSVIRRASQGVNLCSSTFGPPIVPGLNRYWVSISALTRFIKVGLGEHPEVESSILLIYKDSNFITDARYVTFTNWNAPVTYSNVSLGTI